jgi:ppGpp synthetase/RelA/SpoT-type nucleotidyltranferase
MPLTNDDIREAVARYEERFAGYATLTERVYERCLQIVGDTGVGATVQRRAKGVDSLEQKLRRLSARGDPRYTDVDSVFRHMADLAGVRVATYLESDRWRIVEALRVHFRFIDDLWALPNPDVRNQNERGRHYRAIHCQVGLADEDPGSGGLVEKGMSCEVQVCSMLAHVWNELEHDLGYKPLTGTLGEAEVDGLDALGLLVRSGDVIIKALLDANRSRLGTD